MPNPDSRIPSAGRPGVILPKARPPAPQSSSGEGDWERITPATRAQVWKKRFGFRSTGTCVCCHRSTIRRDDFVCGYRRAYPGGGSDVSNLEPICAGCSKGVGTHDLVPWCRKHQEGVKTVKPMPKATTAKKPVRKTTAKKTVRKTAAKKPVAKTAAVRKTVRKPAAKKPAAKKSKK